MSDVKKDVNPFEEENFISGGGLWEGKVVTILSAKTKLDPMTRGDGSAVLNDQGKQVVKNVLEIVAIADDEEAERRETYSAGASLLPTADGEGFLRADGTPGAFHQNCEMAKFAKYIKAGGYDVALLWDKARGRATVLPLVGARFLMKGEAQHDKDGEIKKNKKGYTQQKFYPTEFKGFKANVGGGGGSSAPAPGELEAKAVQGVLEVLAESGGKATRAELVRKLAAKLAQDVDGNKVIALVAKADFHKDRPWTVDGTGYTL